MSFVPAALPRAVVRLLRASPAAAAASGSSPVRCLHTSRGSVRRVSERQHRRIPQQRNFHATPSSYASVKNPYGVLGLDKSASTSEIKKAYYAAAKKYHPDSSKEPNAREKFQEVQAAYEILSDPTKKQQFDQYGEAAFDPSGGFNPGAGGFGGAGPGAGGFSGFGGAGFGADFSFEDIFNAFGAGTGRGRTGRRRNPFQEEILVGENIEVQATISFMEAARGAEKKIRINPLTPCEPCSGSGVRKGSKRQQCGRCGGTGTRVHFMQGGFQMAATCESCGGQGVVIPPGAECKSCDGHGVVREPTTVTVDIPAGIEDGMRLRVSGEGDAPPNGGTGKAQRGDLYVHIKVAPHKDFARKGADIFYTATIPMTTAILGGTVKVPTLDGEVELRVPTGANTGDKITMSGMGMKKLGVRRGANGDLKVEFRVAMPKSLTASQRTLLEMLADEMQDGTAKRVMGLDRFKREAAAGSAGEGGDGKETKPSSEEHGHDGGFLKRAWEKLTHLDGHSSSSPSSSSSSSPKEEEQDEEKKKASGSGS